MRAGRMNVDLRTVLLDYEGYVRPGDGECGIQNPRAQCVFRRLGNEDNDGKELSAIRSR